MHIAEKTSDAHSSQARDQLFATQGILVDMKQSASSQARALCNVQSMLGDLHRLVVGELKTSWEHFGPMITNVCVSTQQIYRVVLEIRDLLTVVDTRWTHFQAPLVVEDVLGYKFPVPSEYDFDLLDTIIRQRFRSGIASKDIIAGTTNCVTRTTDPVRSLQHPD
ncbi:hypothetical protein BU25DRAFT_474950 [Macroventuria anomochaeta]|uniref:Uncharacterized protein n=1 Tax=Macroventuria anomochaeta TaxID=301207 RepID=A0ACB6SF05_9PLEO|nr:uncharacterized protein BU25DRAFT_474950 [Macroventuria anomochaeta]KAF2631904.1 hypothetical protein BU25DRAFT_474950 [Macroventuria anomochaeta]